MTSMKNVQFTRLPTRLVQLCPILFHPLDLRRPIPNKPHPLSPNDNQPIKRKHNSRMTMICYQVFPSGRRFFQYQLINLVWLSVDFFPFSRRKPRPQSYFKILKTSFSPSSFSKKICWGQGWAEASLPAFSGLYNLAGAVVQKHHEEFFYLQLFTFLVLILQSTCFIYTFWKRKQNMEQQPHLACEWMKLKQKQSHFTFKLTTRLIALFSLQIM